MRAMHMMAVVSLALLLTGCSFQPDADAMRAEVEEQVAATIEQDASYQTYREQKDIGRLSEENIYQEDADAAEEQGEVHVTFAKNSLLDVQFFADEALTRPFEAECRLSPGDAIYASVPVSRSESAAYAFDRFRILGHREDDSTEELKPSHGEHIVYEIPEDPSITEISIMPLGKYRAREITLHAVLEDSSISIVNGRWRINDLDFFGDTYTVDPGAPCNISYSFPEDLYYAVEESCRPKPQVCTSGSVVFPQYSVSDRAKKFRVILRKWIQGKVVQEDGSATYTVTVNGEERRATSTLRLKPNDVVTISVPLEDKVVSNLDHDSMNKIGGRMVYTYTIPEDDLPDEPLRFTVKQQNVKTITFQTAENWMENIILPKDENDLLTVELGDTIYHFNELKQYFSTSKPIPMQENDTLTIRFNDSIHQDPNIQFRISFDGENPIYINSRTQELTIRPPREEIDKVEIYMESGYTFERVQIEESNQGLVAQYLDEAGKEIEDGQFLPVGAKVRVVVTSVPEGSAVSGGAVEAGKTEGIVKVKKDTKKSDLVVNYSQS